MCVCVVSDQVVPHFFCPRMSAGKTVLCVYGERKRPVTFEGSTDPVKDRKNLYEAVMATFSDVLEGSSSQTSYFLQQESAEWGGLIDLSGYVEDRTTVHFCSAQTKAEVGSYSYNMGKGKWDWEI